MQPNLEGSARDATSRHAQGWLFVGHGTRDARGVEEFRHTVGQIAEQEPDIAVGHGFLEFASPTLDEALEALATRGATSIKVVPIFLFTAGHMQRDIPNAVERAAQKFPRVEWKIASSLNCHPRLLDLSLLRYREAVQTWSIAADSDPRTPFDPQNAVVLMVGRGSHEPQANSEMARFARLRFELEPTGWAEVSYLSMTTPVYERALEVVAGLPFGHVVVQPHLLFAGELDHRIARGVDEARQRWPEKEWILTEHLGVHSFLIDALLDLGRHLRAAE